VRPDPKSKQARPSLLVYVMRLLIVGVGIGALAGTAISISSPGLRNPAVSPVTDPTKTTQQSNANSADAPDGLGANIASIRMGHELTDLVVKVTPLVRNLTDLVPGVFVMDLDSGDFFSFNGSATFSSASMIKMPILIAFFQDVDAGKVKLDEMLQIQQADIAEGSGEMQAAGVGAQYSALETATNMIINSDNTATNMIIRRLGGIQVLNQRFQQWGLQQTMLRKPLPDLEGANTTSPKELVNLMTLLHQGKLVSMKSRDRAFGIMQRTVTATLLPSVMSPGSTIAHKTGDIGSMVGDVGVIDMPSGRRYAIAEMVKRPFNDPRAQDLIRQIAAVVYQHFGGQPVIVPSLAPSPVQPTPAVSSPGAPTIAPTAPTSADGVPAPATPQQTIPNAMQPGSIPGPAAPVAPAPVEPTATPAQPAASTPVEPTPVEPSPVPSATAPQTGAGDEHADAGITFTPALDANSGWGSR
jgi:beta-lactamase class A